MFEDKRNHVSFKGAYGIAVKYATMNKKNTTAHHLVIHVKWIYPLEGMIKINTDGAVRNTPGLGGLGGIFGDHHGRWLLGYYSSIAHINPLEAD